MKYIILVLFLATISIADEMKRMESIVSDIEKLRKNYNVCIEELSSRNKAIITLNNNDLDPLELKLQKQAQLLEENKILLEKEQMKNLSLASEIDVLKKVNIQNEIKIKDTNKSNVNDSKIVISKEKDDKNQDNKNIEELKIKYEEILKDKENIISSLKNKINSMKKTKTIKKDICKDDNPFPQLMMKDASKKNLHESQKNKLLKDEKITSKAQTYRLNKDSDIYDNVDGKIVFSWENKTSFTSVKTIQDWIEISGYFVDGKWQKTKESLWVKKVNATVR